MNILPLILEQNATYAKAKLSQDEHYFTTHAKAQYPTLMWIGCCDSRVSPELLLGRDLGEIFVYRNIANTVSPNDPSLITAVEFAINGLGIEHFVICGHTECGGLIAATAGAATGHMTSWIEDVNQTIANNKPALDQAKNPANTLSYYHAQIQVQNFLDLEVVRSAKEQKKNVSCYGLLFDIEKGLLEILKEQK